MKEVGGRCGGEDPSLQRFGVDFSHCLRHCPFHVYSQVQSQMFDAFRSFDSKSLESFYHFRPCVDTESLCFLNVDVEATDFLVFLVELE